MVSKLKNCHSYYVCRERRECDGEGMKEPAVIMFVEKGRSVMDIMFVEKGRSVMVRE